VALATGALFVFLRGATPTGLVINEIAFSKADNIDWIEIYNPTLNNISLEGAYLSDNAKNFTKFHISEAIVVPSHSYLVIYCKGYDGDLENSVITNFRISNGETLYLIDKDGSTILDSMTAVLSDEDLTEVSIGRFPDGTAEIFVMSDSTPGATNNKDEINPVLND
jgi:hypothetical protein